MHQCKSKSHSFLCALMICTFLFTGCLESPEEEASQGEISFSIAFLVDQEILGTPNDPVYLAEKFSDESIFQVNAFAVDSEEAMIESLRFGHVDFAMMDAASSWMGWRNYNLEVLVADHETNDRPYYNSVAWVKSDSDIASYHLDDDPFTDPFSLFEGKRPCHTGWFDSVGMLLPMGFLLGLGYANVVGDPNDVESLMLTINDFFSEEPNVPESGTKHYGYRGALRCLSDGTGDIAFLTESTVDDHCSELDESKPSWCLDEDDYTPLPTFGKSPSNALMYNPDFLDSETSQRISDELVALSGNYSMDAQLTSLLGTPGVISTSSEEHLGGYSSLVYNIPGMQSYFEDPSSPEFVNLSVDQITIGVVGPLSNSSSLAFDFLSQSLQQDLGIDVQVSEFNHQMSIIENLSDGEIEIAILGGIGAWMAWKQSQMSVLASILDMNERTYSDPIAIVSSNSDIAIALQDGDPSTDPFALLEGKEPCFTSNLDSPSTIMAIGHLIGNGLFDISDELGNSSIEESLKSFFSENSTFPEENSQYYGHFGALRCLSEGRGEVAFTIEGADLFCSEDKTPSDSEWCLDSDDYAILPTLGRLPHSSVIYDPSVLDMVSRTSVLNSMISLNFEMYLENYTTLGREYTGCYDISIHKVDESSPRGACGSEILSSALESSGFARTTSQSHLDPLSVVIRNLPDEVLVNHCKS